MDARILIRIQESQSDESTQATYQCEGCREWFRIPESLLGPPIVCPRCKARLIRAQPVESQAHT